MSESDAKLSSRYATIIDSAKGLSITFRPSSELTLGSSRREKAIKRRVAKLLRNSRPFLLSVDDEQICATFGPDAEGELPAALSAIDASIEAFKEERLYPKVVEEILQITSRERLRWTKDGRLPRSGAAAFGVGQRSIHFALHPVEQIAALSKSPEIIAAWRSADKKGFGEAVNCENLVTTAETIY